MSVSERERDREKEMVCKRKNNEIFWRDKEIGWGRKKGSNTFCDYVPGW